MVAPVARDVEPAPGQSGKARQASARVKLSPSSGARALSNHLSELKPSRIKRRQGEHGATQEAYGVGEGLSLKGDVYQL